MIRPASLVRRKTISQIEAPSIDYLYSKPINTTIPSLWPENESTDHIPFPGSEGICHQQIKEEEEDTDSDSELEWGVQENMKLFEVSAKDDHGEKMCSLADF
jgi:hypothetical protein